MKEKLKWAALAVLCLALLWCATAVAETGGTDGNITWTLSNNGVLTISGNGPMNNYRQSTTYDSSTAPWGATATSVVIGQGVTSIGSYAFCGCTSLTSVTIPDSITSISSYAFFKCSSLTSVMIPDNVTSIGMDAFAGCSSLTSVTIPDSVTSMGTYVFSGCTNLTNVELSENITSIGQGAFDNCSSLTSVTIPNSVTSIGSVAFRSCSALVNITIPNNVTSLGNYAFQYCSNLTSVSLGTGLTSISSQAFNSCTSLTDITIPDNVTSIGDDAFSSCRNLANVSIGNGVTSIGAAAFRYCYGLENLIFGSGLESIAGHAFEHCDNLTSITTMSNPSTESDSFAYSRNISEVWIVCTSFENNNIRRYANSNAQFYEIHAEIVSDAAVEPDCVIPGLTEGSHCEACGTVVVPQNEIPAIGHSWGNAIYTWNADYSKVTATRVCAHDATHVETETVNTTSEITKAATCEVKGETTYTSTTFENTAFTTQAKTVDDVPALGHDWSEVIYAWSEDNSQVIASRMCANNPEHMEMEIASATSAVTKQATCLENGETTYTSDAFENTAFEVQIKVVDNIPAIGHAWGNATYGWVSDNSKVIATRICSNNSKHFETETANAVSEITTAATCEEKGKTTYTASFRNSVFSTQTKTVADIPALGHDWEEAAYEWNADNSKVTATRVCARDANHVETETVNATSEVTKAATCEVKGETTYTSAAFNNTAFTAQTKTVDNIPASGHNMTATAAKAATCTETGNSAYWKCTVCNKYFSDAEGNAEIEENSWIIPAAGHDWSEPNYEWSVDNTQVVATRICAHNAAHKETETVDTVRELVTAPTDEEAGVYQIVSKEFENTAFTTQRKENLVIGALNSLNVLKLPAFLKTIETEAFENIAAEAIIIPNECTTIEPKAFINCKNLLYIRIPAGIEIPDDAFDGCPNVVIDQR